VIIKAIISINNINIYQNNSPKPEKKFLKRGRSFTMSCRSIHMLCSGAFKVI